MLSHFLVPNMKINAKKLPFPLAFAAQTSARSSFRLIHLGTNSMSMSFPRVRERHSLGQTKLSASGSRTVEMPSIYAVDEVPRLTDLYRTLLETTGYSVTPFNDRAKALAALKVDSRRPALLITNYLGSSMPINQFIQACRLVHPSLRILMASGYEQTEMLFSRIIPDGFIQKPFTPEEFQQAVEATLAQ
jgi:CheY-like chemotaxis protein